MKIHLPGATDGIPQSLCGWLAVECSSDVTRVTCKLCLRARAQLGGLRSVSWTEALHELARLLSGPPSVRVELSRSVWVGMDCRRGNRMTPAAWRMRGCPASALRCRCAVCVAEEDSAHSLIEWDREQQERPHRRYAYPFGSLNGALELLLWWRHNGATVRSSLGSVQARSEETLRLGTHVQTTRRARESLEVRRADMAADIERAIERAFVEAAERRGLSLAQCVEIVVRTVDSERPMHAEDWAQHTGVSASSIAALVKHARRVVTVQLADAGYIPEPRRRAA